MSGLTLAITIIQLLCGILLTVVVLFQSGKSAGLSGAIGGVADSFLAKNKAKTADAKLARATKWIGAVFIILMHDTIPATVDAALRIVDALQAEGYTFVTVEELLALSGVEAQPGVFYCSAAATEG